MTKGSDVETANTKKRNIEVVSFTKLREVCCSDILLNFWTIT